MRKCIQRSLLDAPHPRARAPSPAPGQPQPSADPWWPRLAATPGWLLLPGWRTGRGGALRPRPFPPGPGTAGCGGGRRGDHTKKPEKGSGSLQASAGTSHTKHAWGLSLQAGLRWNPFSLPSSQVGPGGHCAPPVQPPVSGWKRAAPLPGQLLSSAHPLAASGHLNVQNVVSFYRCVD